LIKPTKIKIGGFDYEIIYKDRFNEDGISDIGTSSTYNQKIWIDNQAHIQQQEETLIHEIIEAINSNNDLELKHKDITVLAGCLFQVLNDNGFLKEGA